MRQENIKTILDKIKEYDRIILFRHSRPDGDAIGSTRGFREILRESFPEKEILIPESDYSEYLSFLGKDDPQIDDELYKSALGIVLDTGTTKRISNPKFSLCKELVKIDHHIPLDNYGKYEWVEEHRSSTCEMITQFYDECKDQLKLTKQAALYLYTGMVTDSGRFRFRSVSGETLRLAGILLETGIDTDTLYANLYLKDFNNLKFEAYMYGKIKVTENGVASLYVTKAMQKKFNLSNEDASASVSFMDSIKGALIWLAFIDNDDGSIRVRLRSRFCTVNQIAENYRGGGHDCASGCTVYSKKEAKALLKEADEYLGNYKATEKGWL